MAETSEQPRPWRCNNCNECVDPTMSLCWNCGYDRDGNADPAAFVEAYRNDSPLCAGCGYDLKGNPDADACPECGAPAPWGECKVCGVRGSRAVMADGCPACRATAAGVAFIPEVERKVLTHCPRCRYDLQGLHGVRDCPECERQIGQGVYDTVAVHREKPSEDYALLLYKLFRLGLLFLAVPVGVVVLFLSVVWMRGGMAWAGFLLLAFWVVSLLGSIMIAGKMPAPERKHTNVERRPL